MKNELMNFEGHNVEIIEVSGKILFNPYHVAEILDIKNVRDNIGRMNEKQVVKLTNSDVGNSDIRKLNNAGENFLTESGVYKLVFKSHKENAERFQDWVTDEVLPSIRKTGGYNRNMSRAEFLMELAKSNFENEQRIKSLEAQVSKTSDKLETALNIFTAPSCEVSWKDGVRATVSKMCENSGKCWSVIYGEMYTELEIEAGCNLSARVRKAQERMEKQGYTYKQRRAYCKLDAVADDKKLRAIFEGIIKKYQVRYLQGDNVQEYI